LYNPLNCHKVLNINIYEPVAKTRPITYLKFGIIDHSLLVIVITLISFNLPILLGRMIKRIDFFVLESSGITFLSKVENLNTLFINLYKFLPLFDSFIPIPFFRNCTSALLFVV